MTSSKLQTLAAYKKVADKPSSKLPVVLSTVQVRTVDTDVVVVLIGVFHCHS